MTHDAEPMNFLGIDWGKHDIGIALAHAETRVAVPLLTERNDDGFLNRLCKIIQEEGVGMVIIGIPSHVNRKAVVYPGEILGRTLATTAGVRIEYQDEMFTTKLAQQSLILRGEKHVNRKDDAEAASIILQQWLDQKKPNGTI